MIALVIQRELFHAKLTLVLHGQNGLVGVNVRELVEKVIEADQGAV